MAKRTIAVKVSESGWTKECQTQLEEKRAALEVLQNDLQILEASKKHRMHPSQFAILVAATRKKQTAHIMKLTTRVEALGGTWRAVGKSKFDTGYAEDWKYYIPVNEHYGIGFEMNRILDPVDFDQPVALRPYILSVKKGRYKLDTTQGFRNVHPDPKDRYGHDDWLECDNMVKFNKQIIRMIKLANEFYLQLTAPSKPILKK